MSKLHTLALATLVFAAGAAQANGPAGYDPLAFLQTDAAQAPADAKVVVTAKAEPKKLIDLRKIVHPVAQGHGGAGYDPLAFLKTDIAPQPERAPIVAANTAK